MTDLIKKEPLTVVGLPRAPKPRAEVLSEMLEVECGGFLCEALYYPHDLEYLRERHSELSPDGRRLIADGAAALYSLAHADNLFVPGEWRCDHCEFKLHKRLLSAQDLSVGVDVNAIPDICPNHCVLHSDRTSVRTSVSEVPLCEECDQRFAREVELAADPSTTNFYQTILADQRPTFMRPLTWREADKENSEGWAYLQGLFHAAVTRIEALEAAWPSEHSMPAELEIEWRDAALDPIPMVLHCPNCKAQHIDRPESDEEWNSKLRAHHADLSPESYLAIMVRWENPPHKSHLCHNCKTVWRPADLPTTGVAEIRTRGSRDTWKCEVAGR